MAWSAIASRQARSAWWLASAVQGAAEARAHAVPAPAIGNRGNQLVVGAHGKCPEQKQETPGSLHLPGFRSGRRKPSDRVERRGQVAIVALVMRDAMFIASHCLKRRKSLQGAPALHPRAVDVRRRTMHACQTSQRCSRVRLPESPAKRFARKRCPSRRPLEHIDPRSLNSRSARMRWSRNCVE